MDRHCVGNSWSYPNWMDSLELFYSAELRSHEKWERSFYKFQINADKFSLSASKQ
jgi:hypothetical protein